MRLIKAILNFYLQVRLPQWKIATDDRLTLPTDEKSLKKIERICSLYSNFHNHGHNKRFLLQYCNELEQIENEERQNHHSRFAPSLCDYPLMAETIRAVRSHIQYTTQQKDSELKAYLSTMFLDVVKYESKQPLSSLQDFIDLYTPTNKTSLSLLDRVYLLHNKAKPSSDAQATNPATLFGAKQAAARPTLAVIEPGKAENREAIAKIAGDLEQTKVAVAARK